MNVERIYISTDVGGEQLESESIDLVAASGIVGDRNYGLSKWPGQNLTLIEAEEVEAFIVEQNLVYDLSITRRNIVTRGVRLNELVGKEFLIGTVRLKGVELCEPCSSLGDALASTTLSKSQVVERFLHRAGLRADVLTSGVITVGADVTVT
ncbi:MAG: sulfurase [Porticoccus sp.]|nr:sulfurase [Porticoccus sp.]